MLVRTLGLIVIFVLLQTQAYAVDDAARPKSEPSAPVTGQGKPPASATRPAKKSARPPGKASPATPVDCRIENC
ncbi:MAG: hypothetical protein PHW13_00470 [Methylococcales bacterium]|nr:hypothetical protein [Methylococcales bacterium]